MKVIIAAGGTGGHILPALSFALEIREQCPGVLLSWIGTERSRERELCEKNGIPVTTVRVAGITRKLSLQAVRAAVEFVRAAGAVKAILKSEHPDAVIAFGGYVTAPVLTAARLLGVPFFLQEQNTVPGLVNRLFSRFAACTFLGFPLARRWNLAGKTMVTGTPVRKAAQSYDDAYPEGFDRAKKTVLISGGSQGALTMNRAVIDQVDGWLADGFQVVWQTGEAGYREIRDRFDGRQGAYVFETIPDLYPFFAASRVLVCRAGASTLSEAAYFGIPCVIIPLPWAAENHQWKNAGLAEGQGWGVRVTQSERCGSDTDKWARTILTDNAQYELMSRHALDNSPAGAAAMIVKTVREFLDA